MRRAYLLDESLAQLGSLMAVEAVAGAEAAELYRRRGFPGYYSEYSAFGFLSRSLAGIDAPLTALPADNGFLARRVANSKGMLVWSMLADTLGRDRFSSFLGAYVRANAYGWVTLEEFMASLRSAAAGEVWFIDQWFGTTGAPVYQLEWAQRGRTAHVTIRQTPPVFRARVPVVLHTRTGKIVRHLVDVRELRTRIALQVDGEVQSAALDPEYRVLRWTPQWRAEAEALQPYVQGDIRLAEGHVAEAERELRAALAAVPADDPVGLRARLERSLGDVALNRNQPGAAVEHYRRALAARPVVNEQVPEVLLALADAYSMSGDASSSRRASACAARTTEALLRHMSLPVCDR